MSAILVLFICFFAEQTVVAQRDYLDKNYHRALESFNDQNYHKAIEELNKQLETYPQCIECYLFLGLSYLNTNTVEDSAVIVLKTGLKKLVLTEESTDLYIDLQLTLAKTLQVLLKPDQALAIYTKLKTHFVRDDDAYMQNLDKEISACENAKIFLANPIELTITNLGPSINSEFDDHSPLVSVFEDKLYFTSRRKAKKLYMLDDGQYPEKVYVSNKKDGNWEPAVPSKTFFKGYEHESGLSISPDGKELFIYRNDEDQQSIYMSSLVDNIWGTPIKLPRPINGPYNETSASLTADKSTLFFTSDRMGGYGGMDIYMIKRNAAGQWGKARNLGEKVNTRYDEETAMIHPNGNTLFFASEGHNSMGRMDVFYTQMNPDSTWNEPVNLGYPINTPDDDFFFLPTINQNVAYYASARFNDNYGGSDIYRVEFDSEFKGELAVIEGVVENKSALVDGSVRIMVTRRKDNALVGDYIPDKKDGTYLMFLATDEEYDIVEKGLKYEEKPKYIEVKKEMAYTAEQKILSFEDIKMEPPMVPLFGKTDFEQENQLIEDEIIEEIKAVVNDEPYYTIQVLALKHKPVFAFLYLKGLDAKELRTYKGSDGYTRYVYGAYKGKENCLRERERLLQMGKFNDSFIRPLSDFETNKN